MFTGMQFLHVGRKLIEI